MRSWEWYKTARFKEIEDGEAKKWCDYADVASPVEAVSELDAAVAILLVCCSERL